MNAVGRQGRIQSSYMYPPLLNKGIEGSVPFFLILLNQDRQDTVHHVQWAIGSRSNEPCGAVSGGLVAAGL